MPFKLLYMAKLPLILYERDPFLHARHDTTKKRFGGADRNIGKRFVDKGSFPVTMKVGGQQNGVY
jgi:hypothetical protein